MKSSIVSILKSSFPHMPGFVQDFIYYLYFHSRYKKKLIANSNIYLNALKNKSGIEIGGPSFIFRSVLPVYTVIESCDGVNFSNLTKWEGSITEGMTYRYYGKKIGRQYISECTQLNAIADEKYDFLISSNCLEHTANPLKALNEWLRVIKPGGLFLLVLPKKDNNFDNKRPTTLFQHLVADFNEDMGEDDKTHLEEVLAFHDLTRDLNAGGYERFKETCLNNFENREMHHHVFDADLVVEIFTELNVKLIQADSTESDYIFLGIKKNQ